MTPGEYIQTYKNTLPAHFFGLSRGQFYLLTMFIHWSLAYLCSRLVACPLFDFHENKQDRRSSRDSLRREIWQLVKWKFADSNRRSGNRTLGRIAIEPEIFDTSHILLRDEISYHIVNPTIPLQLQRLQDVKTNCRKVTGNRLLQSTESMIIDFLVVGLSKSAVTGVVLLR